MSGLRPRPLVRTARLEEKAEQRELATGTSGYASAPDFHWARALRLAPPEEVEELQRLCELSQTLEPETHDLRVVLMQVWELQERIQRRESPTLAAFYRTKRDLLHRALVQLEAQAKAAWENEERPPIEAPMAIMERYYRMASAQINREHALRSGVEPMTDLQEATTRVLAVIEAVDAEDIDRVMELVERI